MKIVILGSGVIGTTTAYMLSRAGHEVTVLDRQEGPALETSFANAGEVSPGYSAPWAAPGLVLKAIKWLFMQHRPLVIWPKPDPAMLLELLEELEAAPGGALMVGDTSHDLQMARGAGVDAVAVSYGAHAGDALRSLAPRACVESVAELHAWLTKHG